MVDPKLGTKRQCEACGAKFYDLNKKPVTCPKCGHVYDPMAAAVDQKPVAEIEPTGEAETEDSEDTLEDEDDALSLEDIVEDDGDDDDDDEAIGEFSDDEELLDGDLDDDDALIDDDDEEDGDFIADEDDD